MRWPVGSSAPSPGHLLRRAAVRPGALGCGLQHPSSKPPAGASGARGARGEAGWGDPRGPAKAGLAARDCSTTRRLGLLLRHSLAGVRGSRVRRGSDKTRWTEPLREGRRVSRVWIPPGRKHARGVFRHQGRDRPGVEGGRSTDARVGIHLIYPQTLLL